MELVSIGASEHIDDIRGRLDEEFALVREQGLEVAITDSHKGKLTFLNCELKTQRTTAGRHSNFRQHIANALCDVLFTHWRDTVLRKLVKSGYGYFAADEQEAISRSAVEILQPRGVEQAALHILGQRGQVYSRLLDYLSANDVLVLEGFVTFRLKDYMAELEDAVDNAVDDYLLEREYREFIKLLKYFVDVQEPKISEVNVIVEVGGSFRLVDNQGNVIRDAHLAEFVVEMVDTEVNYDDLLISALVTIAPRKLIMHCRPEARREESFSTIESVFAGRVVFCHGCPMCLPHALNARPDRHGGG